MHMLNTAPLPASQAAPAPQARAELLDPGTRRLMSFRSEPTRQLNAALPESRAVGAQSAAGSAPVVTAPPEPAATGAPTAADSPPEVRVTLPETHCSVNINWEVTYCDESFAKKVGYEASAVIGMSLLKLVPEGDREQVGEIFEMWRAASVVIGHRIRLVTGDEKTISVLLTMRSRYNMYGKRIGGGAIMIDADELDELQDLVKIRKYESLYENSSDMYRTVNYMGVIIDCNKSYRERLGYAKNEIIGTNLLVHTAQRSVERVSANMKKWRNTGVLKVAKDVWMVKKDGTEFPVSLTPTDLYDDDGKMIGMNVIINDMTEMHSAKQAITEFEKIGKLKEEFLSAITHELKTPLTPIIGFTQALLKPQLMGPLSEKQERTAHIILANATKLKQMIGDLLDVHKMDLGKMRFNSKEIEVCNLLDGIKASVDYAVKEKGITLDCRDCKRTTIVSDRTRIEQVLTNMINNAIDFVPKGTGRIEVYADMDGDFVRFAVKDNGIGIPKSKQEHLFKKFYQGDTSITRKHGGTGLGLSICKGIIQNLGGKIGCKSEEGVGSEFFFTIPAEWDGGAK